jgi:hypothetical protein
MCKTKVELSDFREVNYVEVREVLSKEDIEEGIEPETILLTVGLTDHAYGRMYKTENRWVDWVDVQDLIVDKANVFFEVSMGEEFILLNKERTLAVIGELTRNKNGEIIFSVVTIIRNVFVDEYGNEVEKKVRLAKGLPRY